MTFLGIRDMSGLSGSILLGTLRLSCSMLLCAFMILISAGAPTLRNWDLYLLVEALIRAPAGLLLLAIICVAVIEERARKK